MSAGPSCGREQRPGPAAPPEAGEGTEFRRGATGRDRRELGLAQVQGPLAFPCLPSSPHGPSGPEVAAIAPCPAWNKYPQRDPGPPILFPLGAL